MSPTPEIRARRQAGGVRRPGRRLSAVATAIALTLGMAGAVLAVTTYRAAERDRLDRLEMAALATVGDVGQFVFGRQQILEAVGAAPIFAAPTARDVQDRLDRLDTDRLQLDGGIAWVDRRGVTSARRASVLPAGPVRGDLAATVRRVVRTGEPAVSPVLRGAPYRVPVVAIVAPTGGGDGPATGALVAAMTVPWLNGIAASRVQVRGGETLLVDGEGTLFVAPGLDAPRDVGGSALLRGVRAEESRREPELVVTGSTRGVTGVSGTRDVAVGWASEDRVTGWAMFIELPESEAFGPARDDLIAQLLLIAGLAGAGIAGAAWMGRRLDAERSAAALAADRTERLQRVTAALAVATTAEDVAEAVLRVGREATRARAGSIGLLGDDGETITTLALVGYPRRLAEAFPSYPLDADIPMPESIRNGPVWLRSGADVRARYPHLADMQRELAHEGVAAMPLRVDGRAIGGLALSFDTPMAFDDGERAFLLAVADLCAQALDRARLYDEEHRESVRQEFLARASVVLATPQDPRSTLAALARLAVPDLADWCAVSMPEGDRLEVVAVAHADPELQARTEELVRRNPARLDAAQGAPVVMRTGVAEIVPRVTREMIEEQIPPGPDREAAVALGLTSGILAPLVSRGRVLGVLTLANADPARTFGEEDLRFACDLGARAGLAIDNAMLLDHSRHVAAVLQGSLLPERLPEVPGLQVAARYAAGGDGVDVGGDFYDLVAPAGGPGWAAILGDVCGKGPEAAALTALARHTIRAESDLLVPSTVLGRLNDAVLRYKSDSRFLTAVYAWLRPDEDVLRVTVACGGHPPPLILRADGTVEAVEASGSLIGVWTEVTFADAEAVLEVGDSLVLYSDGVTEARDAAGTLFDVTGLSTALREAAGGSAETIAATVMRSVSRHAGDRGRDDVALLVVRLDAVAAGAEDPVDPSAAVAGGS